MTYLDQCLMELNDFCGIGCIRLGTTKSIGAPRAIEECLWIHVSLTLGVQ